MIKVSVNILTYNRLSMLRNCINSVINQNFDDYEIIVLDEHSNDGTEQYLAELTKQYKRLRVIQRKKKGLGYGRNMGVKKSKGEIIAFIDDDEKAHPDWLAKGVEALEKQNADIALGAVYLPNGKLFIDLDSDLEFSTANIFYYKKVIQNIGMFDERFVYGSEDLDLGIRTIESGYRITVCKEAITYHPDRTETFLSELRFFWKVGRFRYTNIVLRFKKHALVYKDKLFLSIFLKKTHVAPTMMILGAFCSAINLITFNFLIIYWLALGLFVASYLRYRVIIDNNISKYLLRILVFPIFITLDFLETIYTIWGAIKYRYLVL